MNDTIFFDFETTGLAEAMAADPTIQPHIIEVCMKKADGTKFETFVNPPIEINEEITKITNIEPAMVSGAPSFAQIYAPMAEFCLGARRWVAHNLAFDRSVLEVELNRIGRVTQFPWPLEFYCTLTEAYNLPESVRPKKTTLGVLYEHITGEKLSGAHRAEVDVDALITVYRWIEDQS